MKSLLLFVGCYSFAQTSVSYSQVLTDQGCKPPIGRVLWHDRIDREQKNTLKADGRADMDFKAGNNEDLNYFITQAITRKVDQLQCEIESDTSLGDQKKKAYLSGIEKILKNFTSLFRSRQFNASHFPAALDAYEQAMKKDISRQSIEQVVDQASYDVGRLVLLSGAFSDNQGYIASKNSSFRKYCMLYPDQVFVRLNENPDVPFRDSLIRVAGYRYPKKLYDFASADNRLGYAIRHIDDPFIQAVSKMAKSGGSGQLYFPFLDNLTNGTQTFDDINAVKDDEAKYYQLLVKTRMDYVKRSLKGEKIISIGVLDTMLQRKARLYFIKEINALHEKPDAVRFQILQQLNPQELYYLIIAGEQDLYTSSYVKGIYPLMMQKIGNRGDSLLMSVSFDRFKKFIKMAAGYNTLSDFMASFPDKDKAQTLMTAFVNGLEKSSGLEDGVDVADSYASIAETIKPVADDMLKNVKLNLDRNVRDNNKRGMVIYNLLYKLFLSADSTKKIDLSSEFGIPPVYQVGYNALADDSSGKVVMQVFFYGDKDGKMNYSGFVPHFANGNWKKTDDNKNWISFSSTKGKPIVIYANKPLDEESGAIDKAQEALDSYLAANGIHPTVIVHRGHSYYAPYTIEQIPASAKIVFLGSCGGYNLIHDVLKHSSDAHIIASKQTGKLNINQPFMDLLNEKLRNGNNIDWIPFWNEFKTKAGKIEGFEDYIPPYKNLGVIFIKAYNSSMGEEE
ncbi:MAG: hypothetical protein ACJ75F_01960 [Flavisolibacter sp.]